jgi:LacI family transcriptional regulator
MVKILVLTDFSSGYSRRLLKGIIRYSREVGPWSFQRMPLYYRMMYGENGVVEFAKKWKADAIIAQLRNVDIELLNALNIPIIVQNYNERNKAVSNLTGNYYETGVMAARFFQGKGFRNYAFYGYKNAIWSRERGLGYKEEVKRNGGKIHTFENKNPDNREWVYNHERLGKWLQSLSKPVALFACDDYYALQISETCNIYNINIPDEISLLGVDNDELLCNISNPPLSSIVLDVENGGYQAGKLLHKLINKEITEAFNIVVNPLYIEGRTSTEKYAVSDKHIQKILTYIDENYINPISVNDLVQQVPLSRRVLEKKFRQVTGNTLYNCIQDHKINQFIHLMLTTDQTLSEVALQSGFDNYKSVSRIFRKYKSVSPAEYRKQYRLNQRQNEEDNCEY